MTVEEAVESGKLEFLLFQIVLCIDIFILYPGHGRYKGSVFSISFKQFFFLNESLFYQVANQHILGFSFWCQHIRILNDCLRVAFFYLLQSFLLESFNPLFTTQSFHSKQLSYAFCLFPAAVCREPTTSPRPQQGH